MLVENEMAKEIKIAWKALLVGWVCGEFGWVVWPFYVM